MAAYNVEIKTEKKKEKEKTEQNVTEKKGLFITQLKAFEIARFLTSEVEFNPASAGADECCDATCRICGAGQVLPVVLERAHSVSYVAQR